MNLQKIAYNLLLLFLTLGASLIIGLLSFGGLYVLWPNLISATLSFVLSVAYEGEIYLQNIKGALNILFIADSFNIELAKTLLRDYFPHHIPHTERPAFFLEYEHALHQLHAFEHENLTASRRSKKREIELKLRQLELKFARILRLHKSHDIQMLSEHDRALFAFLQHYKLAKPIQNKTHLSLIDEFEKLKQSRGKLSQVARYFSLLTAFFMSIGTSYLLLEAFAIIPFLATIPALFVPMLIVPMAIISGVAYGLLTYNTLNNILIHDKIRKNFKKIQEDYQKNGLTWRNGFMASTALILSSLAVMLTICTGGTWLTIIKNTPPLFRWMSKVPSAILGVFTALITSVAALAFNLENSCESLEMIDEAIQDKKNMKREWDDFKFRFKSQWDRENFVQRLNPFRIILITTLLPVRFLLFFGHLISIGVTTDRVPGLSKSFSATLGIISELFEDGHYFIKNKRHQHNTKSLINERLSGEDHNHDDDLPSRILKAITWPIYALSVAWEYISSQFNRKQELRLSMHQLLNRNSMSSTTPVENTSNNPAIETNLKPKQSIQSIGKISSLLTKNSSTSIKEEPAFDSCPCCPPIYMPYIKNKELPQMKSNIKATAAPKERFKTQDTSTPSSATRVRPSIHTPAPFDMNFCTVINKSDKTINPRKYQNTSSSNKPQTKIKPNIQTPASSFFNTEFCTVISEPAKSSKKVRPKKSKLVNETATALIQPTSLALSA